MFGVVGFLPPVVSSNVFPVVVRSFPFLLALLVFVYLIIVGYVSYLSVSSAFSVHFFSSFFVALRASQSSSAFVTLLRSPLGLPVLSFASLQSWSSLLRIFYSVSALLVQSHSLSVLLSTVTLCGCLLPCFAFTCLFCFSLSVLQS